MKTIKITKKSMIVLVCIILLIAIGVIVISIVVKKVNNPYGVKVVDLPLPKDYQYYNFSKNNKYFIQNADDLNKILDKRYSKLNDEQKKNYKSDKMIFRKYDDEFFKSNFIYFAKSSSPYYGGSSLTPRFKLKKCFYSEEKGRLILEARITDKVFVDKYVTLESPIETDWRGYIIEFPRSIFEEHDLTYDDIQIVYTNMKPRAENSQLGLDKYFNDPDYPKKK